jgi:8-oxo-dGTP pyrophosphatase MutT (NUDIX family)
MERDGSVLLMRRAGSGYRDGQLSLPAGHLDGDEDAIAGMLRELREELGIEAARDDCQLMTVLHRRRETPADNEYVDLIFKIATWRGEPSIMEQEKCGELVWVNPEQVPGIGSAQMGRSTVPRRC